MLGSVTGGLDFHSLRAELAMFVNKMISALIRSVGPEPSPKATIGPNNMGMAGTATACRGEMSDVSGAYLYTF